MKGFKMSKAKNGDKVVIDYRGRLEDGAIFDSTFEEDCEGDECSSESCDCESGECDDDCGCGEHEHGPMEFVIGSGSFFTQVEEALVGMEVGETKKITIPAEDAFGDYDKEKVFAVPRSDLPEDLKPTIGDELILTNEEDEEIAVVVVATTDDTVTFDTNHPLAG